MLKTEPILKCVNCKHYHNTCFCGDISVCPKSFEFDFAKWFIDASKEHHIELTHRCNEFKILDNNCEETRSKWIYTSESLLGVCIQYERERIKWHD